MLTGSKCNCKLNENIGLLNLVLTRTRIRVQFSCRNSVVMTVICVININGVGEPLYVSVAEN
jgi:hypothetical protein